MRLGEMMLNPNPCALFSSMALHLEMVELQFPSSRDGWVRCILLRSLGWDGTGFVVGGLVGASAWREKKGGGGGGGGGGKGGGGGGGGFGFEADTI